MLPSSRCPHPYNRADQAAATGSDVWTTHPLLLFGALLGFHINLALPVASGVVPHIIAAPFALALFVVHWRKLTVRIGLFLLLLVGFYAVSAAYAVGFRGGSVESIIPLGLLLYSLCLGLGIYLELLSWPREKLNRLAITIAIGLVTLAALEIFTPLQQIGLWFSQFHTNQTNIVRDVVLYGGYRPRLFTSEPAHAAISIVIALIVWIATVPRWTATRFAMLGAIVLIALVLVRSPFFVLPMIVLGAKLALDQAAQAKSRALQAGRFAMIIVGGLATFTLVTAILGNVFSTRIETFDPHNDWSVTTRTYGGLLAGWNTSLANPIFGAGVNNFEAAPEVAETYRQLGVPSYVTDTEVLEVSVNNGVALALVFFGFGGILVYLFIWDAVMKSLAPRISWQLRWVAFLCVSVAFSEIYAPRTSWMILIILAGFMVGTRPFRQQASRSAPQSGRVLLTRGKPGNAVSLVRAGE